jgi:hypothetical protein
VCLCVFASEELLSVSSVIFTLVPDYAFCHSHSLSATDSVEREARTSNKVICSSQKC